MPVSRKVALAIFTLIGLWAMTMVVVVIAIDIQSLPWRPELKNLLIKDPAVQHLVFIFVGFLETVIGGVGLAILILTYGPFRQGQRWSTLVLVVLSLAILLPQLVTWIRLGNPWYSLVVVSTLIGLTITGGYLGNRKA